MNICSVSLEVLQKLGKFNIDWSLMEKDEKEGLWAGREIDETGSKGWLLPENGRPWFIKGKMIDRFSIRESDFHSIGKELWVAPASANQEKIIWRDVSRSNQKRRMIAQLSRGICC